MVDGPKPGCSGWPPIGDTGPGAQHLWSILPQSTCRVRSTAVLVDVGQPLPTDTLYNLF
jgi:hypothetical protein